jgi:phospholipase/carboxylesterase
MAALTASGSLRAGPAAGGAPTSLVIFLHGYGSNGADLIGLAPFWRQTLAHTLFLSPNAPQPCPGAPGGYQWWAFSGSGAASTGPAQAAPLLEAFIDAELKAAGLAADRLALVGFSQGTMMALAVGLQRTPAVAGIVGYSGRLSDAGVAAAARAKPPILLVHGDDDPMIPLAAFFQTRSALTAAGLAVESHVSNGLGHSIDGAGLSLGGAFLARVLGAA